MTTLSKRLTREQIEALLKPPRFVRRTFTDCGNACCYACASECYDRCTWQPMFDVIVADLGPLK